MCILYIIIHVHVHTAGVTGLPGSNVKLEQAMGSTAVDDSSRKREVRLMKNRYLIHTMSSEPLSPLTSELLHRYFIISGDKNYGEPL